MPAGAARPRIRPGNPRVAAVCGTIGDHHERRDHPSVPFDEAAAHVHRAAQVPDPGRSGGGARSRHLPVDPPPQGRGSGRQAVDRRRDLSRRPGVAPEARPVSKYRRRLLQAVHIRSGLRGPRDRARDALPPPLPRAPGHRAARLRRLLVRGGREDPRRPPEAQRADLPQCRRAGATHPQGVNDSSPPMDGLRARPTYVVARGGAPLTPSLPPSSRSRSCRGTRSSRRESRGRRSSEGPHTPSPRRCA